MKVLKPSWTDEEIKFLRDHYATMKSLTSDIMRGAAGTIDKKWERFTNQSMKLWGL